MARKTSNLVLEMNKRYLGMLRHTQKCIDCIAKGVILPDYLGNDPEVYIKRTEGYNVAFEDLLHISKCYNGFNYLDKKMTPLIWYPQYERIQDHPEFAEWRRSYYV